MMLRLLLLCRRQCCQQFRVRRRQLNVRLGLLLGLQRLCLPLRHQQPFLRLFLQLRPRRLFLQLSSLQLSLLQLFLPLRPQQLSLQQPFLRLLFLLLKPRQLFSQPLNHFQPFLQPQFLLRLNHRLKPRRLFLRLLKPQPLFLQLLNLLLPSLQLRLLQLFLRLRCQQLSFQLLFLQLKLRQPFLRLNLQRLNFQQLSLQPFFQPLSLLRLNLPLLNRLLPFHLLKSLPLFPHPLPTTNAGVHDPCPTTERVSSLTATSAMRRV